MPDHDQRDQQHLGVVEEGVARRRAGPVVARARCGGGVERAHRLSRGRGRGHDAIVPLPRSPKRWSSGRRPRLARMSDASTPRPRSGSGSRRTPCSPGAGGGDEVLLTRMSARTRIQGRWTLPGGGIDHGEDPRDALRREVLRGDRAARRAGPRPRRALHALHRAPAPTALVEDYHGVHLIFDAASCRVGGRRAARRRGRRLHRRGRLGAARRRARPRPARRSAIRPHRRGPPARLRHGPAGAPRPSSPTAPRS